MNQKPALGLPPPRRTQRAGQVPPKDDPAQPPQAPPSALTHRPGSRFTPMPSSHSLHSSPPWYSPACPQGSRSSPPPPPAAEPPPSSAQTPPSGPRSQAPPLCPPRGRTARAPSLTPPLASPLLPCWPAAPRARGRSSRQPWPAPRPRSLTGYCRPPISPVSRGRRALPAPPPQQLWAEGPPGAPPLPLSPRHLVEWPAAEELTKAHLGRPSPGFQLCTPQPPRGALLSHTVQGGQPPGRPS